MEDNITTILIRIDKDIKKDLKVLAAKQDLTMSQLIRKSITNFIKDGNQETTN